MSDYKIENIKNIEGLDEKTCKHDYNVEYFDETTDHIGITWVPYRKTCKNCDAAWIGANAKYAYDFIYLPDDAFKPLTPKQEKEQKRKRILGRKQRAYRKMLKNVMEDGQKT